MILDKVVRKLEVFVLAPDETILLPPPIPWRVSRIGRRRHHDLRRRIRQFHGDDPAGSPGVNRGSDATIRFTAFVCTYACRALASSKVLVTPFRKGNCTIFASGIAAFLIITAMP
jgi:hypothetical protein